MRELEKLKREASYHQQELNTLMQRTRDAQDECKKKETHIQNMTRLWFEMDDCEQGSVEQDDLINEMFEVIRNYHNGG